MMIFVEFKNKWFKITADNIFKEVYV